MFLPLFMSVIINVFEYFNYFWVYEDSDAIWRLMIKNEGLQDINIFAQNDMGNFSFNKFGFRPFMFTYKCNWIGDLVMNRTSRVPKSVLRFDVDKDLTSVWYSACSQSCFPIFHLTRTKNHLKTKFATLAAGVVLESRLKKS